jgi:hypothetical protein
MKTIIITLLATVLVGTPSLLGQAAPPGSVPTRNIITSSPQSTDGNLAKFDLDFPGGTPRQLVEAIEKASSRPLNAIILDDDAHFQLPPLKMKSVAVPELFAALTAVSLKAEASFSGVYQRTAGGGISPQFNQYSTQYGFQTQTRPVTEDSVWYFRAEKPFPMIPPKTCRLWQLAGYLEEYKVEDITTAIQTSWKMLGETNSPTINFHKDTKLLIAVGEAGKLQLIDSVLEQLDKGKPQPQRESTGTKTAEPAKK